MHRDFGIPVETGRPLSIRMLKKTYDCVLASLDTINVLRSTPRVFAPCGLVAESF